MIPFIFMTEDGTHGIGITGTGILGIIDHIVTIIGTHIGDIITIDRMINIT